MKQFLLAIVLLATLGSSVSAEDCLDWLKARCHHSDVRPQPGSIQVRAWPLNQLQVKLPPARSNQTLKQVFGPYDTLSVTAALIQANASASNASRDVAPPTNSGPPLPSPNAAVPGNELQNLATTGTSNVVAIVRARKVIAFPRVLMAHPAVCRIRLDAGDLIVSLRSIGGPPPRIQEAILQNRVDPFLMILPGIRDLVAGEGDIVVPVFGPLLNDAVGNQLEVRARDRISSYVIAGDALADKPSVFRNAPSDLEKVVPIAVLYRQVGETSYVYLIPARTQGLFAEQGKLLLSLTVGGEPEQAREIWRTEISAILAGASFHQGDRIEVTELSAFLMANGMLVAP